MFTYKGCVYTVQLHTFQSIGWSVQLLPFFLPSQFQVWIFWGRFEVCSASLSKGWCSVCIMGCTCHRMWHAASLQTGVRLVLFTPSKGESWRVRGIIHIKKILLFQFCYYFCRTFCSLLSLALCPAGTSKQAGRSCSARGHLHLLPHVLAVAFGFAQVPPKTTLLISLVLQTHSLIKMLSWCLGDVGLFPCKHSRLS